MQHPQHAIATQRSRWTAQRIIAVGFVAALHVAVIYAFIAAFVPPLHRGDPILQFHFIPTKPDVTPRSPPAPPMRWAEPPTGTYIKPVIDIIPDGPTRG